MNVYSIGDIVVCTHKDKKHIGEVIGVRAMGGDLLYDVSLERKVLKARLSSELHPADPNDIHAIIAEHTMDLERIAKRGARVRRRNDLLHNEYIERLSIALDAMRKGVKAPHLTADGYEVGDQLVVKKGDGLFLGKITASLQRNDELVYQVDVEGEIESHMGGELFSVSDFDFTRYPFKLGDRVRMLAEGHEEDPDFEATICSMEGILKDEVTYSIAFDDGDVFEGLTSQNLLHLE